MGTGSQQAGLDGAIALKRWGTNERNPMPETRTGSSRRFWPPAKHAAAASAQQTVRGANAAFGPSDFGILSGLGLRPSDFAHFPTASLALRRDHVGHCRTSS